MFTFGYEIFLLSVHVIYFVRQFDVLFKCKATVSNIEQIILHESCFIFSFFLMHYVTRYCHCEKGINFILVISVSFLKNKGKY